MIVRELRLEDKSQRHKNGARNSETPRRIRKLNLEILTQIIMEIRLHV